MITLTIRTDKPEAEIGLFDGSTQLAYDSWQAHRELAETLHSRIETLLQTQYMDWASLQAIVCFQGPGSFTGLRIGLTVANSLAYSFSLPVVAEQDEDWITQGLRRLAAGGNDSSAQPFYGAEAHITAPKK